MWYPLSLLLFLYISKINAGKSSCITPEGKQGTCAFIDYCPSILKTFVNSSLTRESIPGLICNNAIDAVCCSAPRTFSSYATELSDRRYCGFQRTDDYGHDEYIATIDEFPWLAVILGIYFDAEKQLDELLCHGSLINNRYLLSAAHCFKGPGVERYNTTGVLLGEYEINNNEDCIDLPKLGLTECTEAERFQIEETIIHPFYSWHRHELADIALIRLNKVVTYTDFIRPICLPVQGTVFAKVGNVLYRTGWGPSGYGVAKAFTKKKIRSVLVTIKECQNEYEKQISAVPAISFICTTDFLIEANQSCQAESGGPVMFKHKNQWHMEGIVSRGKGCGLPEPGLHVRITSHLEWIKQNIRP